jgi:3-oxoacyl-[acyl-carrier protein] reductase
MTNGGIIVSGGSRGLGLVFVRHCLSKGAAVASFARSTSDEMNELAANHPDRFFFAPVDATDRDAVSGFVGTVAKRFGSICGLINNAAIGQDHLLAHMSPEIMDRILDINLRAPIMLTREVIRHMLLNANGGRIVNISSICGSRGYQGLTVYSACKGGLDAMTRSLAREVGERGILVNSLAPGFFSSEMSEVLDVDQMNTIRRRTPTDRLTTPEDLLATLDLLIFEPGNITGQVLTVDGGSGI